MKALYFILFLFLISACEPLNLDDAGGTKPRNPAKRDTAKGEDIFKIPDNPKPSDYREVAKKAIENCQKYTSTGLFGRSLTEPIRNCLAKAVDEGLTPMCNRKAQAQRLLKLYQKEGDHEKIDATQDYISALDDVIYDYTDDIYELADEVDDTAEELLDDLEEEKERNDDFGSRVGVTLGKFLVKREVGSITTMLDQKAKLACQGQLDFSKINRR